MNGPAVMNTRSNMIFCLGVLICISGIGPYASTGEAKMSDILQKPKYINRLSKETSPYLLQHAHNPVDWYPWSKEAFEAAKKQDKPIFLSIGYSTCHWCHVMAHESFENEEIAKIMNQYFVSIKVDREQRPDIDSVYMKAVQAMTGSGGWPLSAFLTPDGKPFYGGTYFPPEDNFGRPGFKQLLLAIADAWEKNRPSLLKSADNLTNILAETDTGQKQELSENMIKNAADRFSRIFDPKYGGFGTAPKFPQASILSMLIGYSKRSGDEKILSKVTVTLDGMAKGGIYDHLGGGFHRYSTDAKWLVPHFEKMLYDQALISKSYLQAYQVTGNTEYKRIVTEIFEYLLRDMTDSEGGFYSAEDADSEGEEGVFYVWDPDEIEKLLSKEQAKIFKKYYGVTKRGNFEHGKSILHVTKSIKEFAKEFNTDAQQVSKLLSQGRQKLFEARSKRVRPGRDEKIITAWNGLMISSLSYGGAVMGEEKYIRAAKRAAEFVSNKLLVNGRLMRFYGNGKAIDKAVLNDYAFLITGLLDLYEATFDAKWLSKAKELSDQIIELFGDENKGAFFLTGKDAERLILRNKPDYDGALPTGNSAAALGLLRLGQMTMEPKYTKAGEEILREFSGRLKQIPSSLTYMLTALDFWLGPRQEIVIAGKFESKETKQMLRLIYDKFLPNTVVLLHEEGKSGQEIESIVPFIKGQNMIDDRATAYVCENFVCNQPVNKLKDLERILADIYKK